MEIPTAWLDKISTGRRLLQWEPEHDLMEAILLDAIRSICQQQRGSPKSRRERHDALLWLLSKDTEWTFSALNCCETLGISHAAVLDDYRKGLLRQSVKAHLSHHQNGRIKVGSHAHAA